MTTYNVVGVKHYDPYKPGRMYLNSKGELTKHIDEAKPFSKHLIEDAIKEVKAYSNHVFACEVTAVANLI